MTENERKLTETIKTLRIENRNLKLQAAEKDEALRQLRLKLSDLIAALDQRV